MRPTVVAIHVMPASRAPKRPLQEARAVESFGIEGDHHARPGQRQVLLIEIETLEALGLAPGDVREQVTVRGLELGRLPEGTGVRIGSAEFEVAGPCAPCGRMDEIRPGLRAVLEGRRGRFLRVVRSGALAVGEPVEIGSAPAATPT